MAKVKGFSAINTWLTSYFSSQCFPFLEVHDLALVLFPRPNK